MILKLQGVSVAYTDKAKVIDNLSFTLGESDNLALIGENGAGKTSLLLAIVGVLETVSGTIEAGGTRLNKKTLSEIRKKIGLVFQNPDDQLFMPLIYDDIAFGCRNLGLPEEQIKTRAEGTLFQLNISHLRDRSPLKLSGGEKRMAAIATVLAMNPNILMFDEPATFLDPKAKRALAEILKNLRHPKIIATHDLAFAAQVCNRVIILKEGRIMADGALSLLNDEELMRKCGL